MTEHVAHPHTPGNRPLAAALSPARSWIAVSALTLSVFAVTATEMLPVGVLPSISDDLGVSVGVAGLSVTLYGMVAGLAAPLTTRVTHAADRRAVVLAIIATFVLGNAGLPRVLLTRGVE